MIKWIGLGSFLVTVAVACGTIDINQELLDSAERGDSERLIQLVEKEPEIDAQDEFGRTPLMLAALNGHIDVVRLLLENGANPAIEAKFGATALSFAETKGYEDIVEVLGSIR
jgi:ankyrin repeat protein